MEHPNVHRSRHVDNALAYAARGWAVLPLHCVRDGRCTCGSPACARPAKHPIGRLVPRGVKDATTDQVTIRPWWAEFPDANVGIATGAVSGLVVLDVDPRHRGDDSLAALERQHGPLLQSVRAMTGGGGSHPYFSHPGGIVSNKVAIAPGLDVRGDGGYVVAPPSIHETGRRYEWDAGASPGEAALQAPPAWLLTLISNGGSERRRADGITLEIREGERNRRLYELACGLRRHGLGERAIREALAAINRYHVVPPIEDDELGRIAASAARRAPAGTFPETSAPPSRTYVVKVG
jgi:hypothetical protein